MITRTASDLFPAFALAAVAVCGLSGCGARSVPDLALVRDGSVGDAASSSSDSASDADSAFADAPSCAPGGPGLSDCGENHESCCSSLLVSGGTFLRVFGTSVATPTAPATISTFRLDKYDVTVARFRQFTKAIGAANERFTDGGVLLPDSGPAWVPAAGSGKHSHLRGGLGLSNATSGGYEPGWEPSHDDDLTPTVQQLACNPTTATTAIPGDQDPINCVTWYEAYAFCIWDGGFMPSEAEWEYAAAGGGEQRMYPWGSSPPGATTLYAVYNCHYSGPGGCQTAPVGTATLGAGKWGQVDLVGNVDQWTLDYWNGFVDAGSLGQCTDCAYFPAAPEPPYTLRNAAGGAYYSSEGSLGSQAIGNAANANQIAWDLGFRCARVP